MVTDHLFFVLTDFSKLSNSIFGSGLCKTFFGSESNLVGFLAGIKQKKKKKKKKKMKK
jgi:hypothetical protein